MKPNQPQAGVADASRPEQNPKPEWVDVAGVEKLFGLRRSFVYNLIAENRIASVSIRQRGKLRGKRMVSCDSVRALFFLAEGGSK